MILCKPSEVDTVDGFPLRLLPETGTCANPRLEGDSTALLRLGARPPSVASKRAFCACDVCSGHAAEAKFFFFARAPPPGYHPESARNGVQVRKPPTNSIFMCAVEKAGKGSRLGATSCKAVKQARVLKQPSDNRLYSQYGPVKISTTHCITTEHEAPGPRL